MFDYLVVGAGFAGSVIAERLASQAGKKILIIDKRDHIGGNAYDYFNNDGILIHKYGPHIFHTNSKEVFEYLGQFTPWRPYEHKVLGSVDGQLVPIPINLNTINQLYGLNLNSSELEDFFASKAEKVPTVKTSEDVVVSKVGRELYDLIFTGPVDEYFDYCYGKLPYRSLEFKFETIDREVFQSTGTINYPNGQLYTRITDFKYLTGQVHPKTAIVYEFPKEKGDPYYPVPRPENAELYRKYQQLAASMTNTYFVGRLATYKYYNMDQVVGQALAIFNRLAEAEGASGLPLEVARAG